MIRIWSQQGSKHVDRIRPLFSLVRIIMHDNLTLKARAKKLGQSDMIHARGSSWPFVKSSAVLTVIPRFRRRARDVESKLRQRKIISFYAQSFNRYA